MKKTRRNSFCVPTLPPLGSRQNFSVDNNNNNNNNKTRPPLPPGHFLRDVNLDGDLLSIPDPPSPPKKRNARRQSSPMMMRPLHDISNEKTNNVPVTGNNKRSRKSLCHVPSPAGATEANDDESDESVKNDSEPLSEEKIPSSSSEEEPVTTPGAATLDSVICFDDNDDIVVSSSKRQKRRESMILPSDMAPLPMEDTQDDMLDCDVMNEKHVDAETEFSLEPEYHDDRAIMASKRPAKRQSIVLPSDIASFKDEVANEVFGRDDDSPKKEAAGGDDDAAKEQAMALQLEEEDETPPRKSSRHSKRQSMILPSDACLLQDDEASEYFCKLQSHQMNESQSEESDELASTSTESMPTNVASIHQEGVSSAGKETAVDAKTGTEAELIRKLVREYCSLPVEERTMSKQAEEIERLTGYSLVPLAAKHRKAHQKNGVDLNWSGSPHDDEPEEMVTKQNESVMAKRELLLKLGAMVDLMDKRKVEDTKKMEASTGCRSQRSRSGKYRYYHLFSNRKISPADYEELYLATLEQSKADISKRIQDWLRESDMSEDEIDEQCIKISALVEAAQQPVEEDEAQGSEASPLQDSIQPLEPAKLENDPAASESDMEESPSSDSECAVDSGKSDSPPRVVVEQARDDVTPNDDSGDNMEEGVTSMLSLADASVAVDTIETHENCDRKQDASESPELLLPFPSRDETSNDPEIAAAEKTLWSEIDAALERYSQQVIAIREARASEQNES